jgi:hypothetical protein
MPPPSADPRPMFERLCLLRSLYERRGPLDSTGVMTIDGAIRYAETLLAFARPAQWPPDRSADSTV